MANEFNPQLSKARMQKSGVVDQTAGMDYQLGADLLKTGVKEYGEYQVRNLNEEINEIVSSESAVNVDEANALKGFNDEIGLELLREQQGVTNQQQKAFNINKAAAEAKARAPWLSDQIDKTVNSKLGLTGAGSRKASSAMEVKTQTQIAKTNLMKQRENLSLKFYGVSSTKLSEEQYKQLRNFERAQVSNQMEEVALKTEQLAFDRSELDDKKLKEVEEDNKLRINRVANTDLVSLNSLVAESMNAPDLSLESYDATIALYTSQVNSSINKVTKMYNDAGMAVDQTFIDSLQKRADNTVKNFQGYKKLTPEMRNKVKMDEYLKVVQVQEAQANAGMQNLMSLEKRMNFATKKGPVKNLLSSNKTFSKTEAIKFWGETYVNKFVSEDKGFDGVAMFNEVTMPQGISGFTIEKDFGESKAIELNVAAAKIKNFGLSDTDTNLLIEGENKDPQTDSIVFLSDKQTQRADEVVNYSGKDSDALPFVESNLKMLNSNNYTPGNPNTEISNYRAEQVDNVLQTSASYVSRAIAQNPDSVEIVNGEVTSSDEAVMRSIDQMYMLANKFKNIPNAKAKILSHITKIKEDAIESSVVTPMKEEVSNEINTNPIYSSLSQAEKDELMDEVIKNERSIQVAENLKLRQAAVIERTANKIGSSAKYNESGIRTALENVSKLTRLNTTGQERLKAAAYIGLTGISIKDKVIGNVEKYGRKLFGDTLVEKTEAEYDKKLGLPRFQARTIKAIQSNTMSSEKAARIYNQMLPLQEALEDREALGEELTGRDAELYKYYNKFIDSYDKSYGNEVSLSDMPVRTDTTAAELTERIEAGQTLTEAEASLTEAEAEASLAEEETLEQVEAPINIVEKPTEMYDLTFNNEIGRGRNDSRELHLPSKTSGVTIGPGYDLGDRTAEEIVADLTSVGVTEEDANRIAQGAGLKGTEAESFIDDNDDIEITDEQERQLFDKIVPMYEERAVNDYEAFDIEGKPSYDELPDTVKNLLVDYSYNVGASTFPKFFNALVTGNKEEALAQYKRYTNNKPLGRRNKDTLKVLNSYNFTDLTQ